MEGKMTIDEAIKLIQADIDDDDVDWNSPLGEAYKLGFEALKAEEKRRRFAIPDRANLLPGETES